MHKIRVLVADDSAVYRKIISEALNRDPKIEVIGTAANGEIAVDFIKKHNPDVVILDLEMPVLNGLEVLEYLNKNNIRTGVIVFSAYSYAGAHMTFEALEKGAFDFVTKPSNYSFLKSLDEINSILVPKIKACYIREKLNIQKSSQKGITSANKFDSPSFITKEAVAIGVSTGGPTALKELISNLDTRIYVPIFIVQHMPSLFITQFVERLDKLSPFKVKEAKNGEQVEERVIYIAPGDYHMEVYNQNGDIRIRLHKGPPENNCRPSVNVLFRSVAQVYNKKTLAVVLTGMGDDGLEGAKLLKRKGAYIIAQDKATSVVWGMPKAIVDAGLANKVLPLPEIPKVISKLVKSRCV